MDMQKYIQNFEVWILHCHLIVDGSPTQHFLTTWYRNDVQKNCILPPQQLHDFSYQLYLAVETKEEKRTGLVEHGQDTLH